MLPGLPLPVIVNAAGGTASRAGEGLRGQIEAAFAAAGRPIALELVAGEDLPAALDRHAGAPRVAVGGGDGTLATAAQALSRRGGELAILPLGTRNHFACQLGVPLDLAGAARLAATGKARQVDLGDAGGRVFINNLSAGAYVELVRERATVNAMLADIAGKQVADANVTERAKVQKQIIRDCLAGTNGRDKVEGWLPSVMAFPFRSYTDGTCSIAEAANIVAGIFPAA